MARERDDERRRARRDFVRRHHPDLGGDVDTFIAGLARLDVRQAGPEVVFVRRARGVQRLASWLVARHRRLVRDRRLVRHRRPGPRRLL